MAGRFLCLARLSRSAGDTINLTSIVGEKRLFFSAASKQQEIVLLLTD